MRHNCSSPFIPSFPHPSSDIGPLPPSPSRVTPRVRRLYRALGVVLVFIGIIRIISTYRVFSQMFDEPIHLACGLEWWDKGTYNIERQHPPLARIAIALGPYVSGIRSLGLPREEKSKEGNLELNANNAYWSNLTRARMGILPFYLVACIVVWMWADKAFGTGSALMAILLFTGLPPILGHSSLATTDMAITATLCASLFCFVLWFEKPALPAI
jgi:hypothetical protein